MGKVYSPEFRRKAVELFRLDDETTYVDVARELGCSAEAIRNWVRQADRDEGRRDDGGVTSDERERLRELERKNLQLEKENRILKAATAYFAREQL